MQFKPQSEAEIRDNKYLPNGIYPIAVKNAADKLPPGGTQSIELVVIAARGDGRMYSLYDSLSTGNMQKLREAAVAFGLAQQYASGELSAAHFAKRTAYARIILRAKKGDYPEKNVIATYVSQGLMR